MFFCLQEVVTRFEYQEDTTAQLEELKTDNEKKISRLREDKEKSQQEFEEMKYTGEAKMSRYRLHKILENDPLCRLSCVWLVVGMSGQWNGLPWGHPKVAVG